MSEERTAYIVDTARLTSEERSTVVRVVLNLLAGSADCYECDVPLSRRAAWPTDVQAAADRLTADRPLKRSENDQYRTTGVLHRGDDPGAWDAFTTFAAHAYDATVWDDARRPLVELADEGTSCCAHLTEAEASALTTALPGIDLVLLSPWRRWWRRGRSTSPDVS
jgi:hypothetical protein